jgi:hypothetical protein
MLWQVFKTLLAVFVFFSSSIDKIWSHYRTLSVHCTHSQNTSRNDPAEKFIAKKRCNAAQLNRRLRSGL